GSKRPRHDAHPGDGNGEPPAELYAARAVPPTSWLASGGDPGPVRSGPIRPVPLGPLPAPPSVIRPPGAGCRPAPDGLILRCASKFGRRRAWPLSLGHLPWLAPVAAGAARSRAVVLRDRSVSVLRSRGLSGGFAPVGLLRGGCGLSCKS